MFKGIGNWISEQSKKNAERKQEEERRKQEERRRAALLPKFIFDTGLMRGYENYRFTDVSVDGCVFWLTARQFKPDEKIIFTGRFSGLEGHALSVISIWKEGRYEALSVINHDTNSVIMSESMVDWAAKHFKSVGVDNWSTYFGNFLKTVPHVMPGLAARLGYR